MESRNLDNKIYTKNKIKKTVLKIGKATVPLTKQPYVFSILNVYNYGYGDDDYHLNFECPDDYLPITTEEECRFAAEYMNFAKEIQLYNPIVVSPYTQIESIGRSRGSWVRFSDNQTPPVFEGNDYLAGCWTEDDIEVHYSHINLRFNQKNDDNEKTAIEKARKTIQERTNQRVCKSKTQDVIEKKLMVTQLSLQEKLKATTAEAIGTMKKELKEELKKELKETETDAIGKMNKELEAIGTKLQDGVGAMKTELAGLKEELTKAMETMMSGAKKLQEATPESDDLVRKSSFQTAIGDE